MSRDLKEPGSCSDLLLRAGSVGKAELILPILSLAYHRFGRPTSVSKCVGYAHGCSVSGATGHRAQQMPSGMGTCWGLEGE